MGMKPSAPRVQVGTNPRRDVTSHKTETPFPSMGSLATGWALIDPLIDGESDNLTPARATSLAPANFGSGYGVE